MEDILLVECKLTQTLLGQAQLLQLYGPLLSFMYPTKKIYYLNVYQNIVLPSKHEISTFKEYSSCPQKEVIDLQWLVK